MSGLNPALYARWSAANSKTRLLGDRLSSGMKYLAMETPSTAEVDKTAALPLPAGGDRKRGRKPVREQIELPLFRDTEGNLTAVAC